jgi:hypothetical protein
VKDLQNLPTDSDDEAAIVAALQHIGMPNALWGMYLLEAAYSNGVFDRFIVAADVHMGILLANSQSRIPADAFEDFKHKQGRRWRCLKKRTERHERAAGVRFSERRVPDGRDPSGRSYPAELRFTLGTLKNRIKERALLFRGPRRFRRAAEFVIKEHQVEIAATSVPLPNRQRAQMTITARTRRICTDFEAAYKDDPDRAATTWRLIGMKLGLADLNSTDESPFSEGRGDGFLGAEGVVFSTSPTYAADLFCSVNAEQQFTFVLKDDHRDKVFLITGKNHRTLRHFKREQFEKKFEALKKQSGDRSVIIGASSQSYIHLDDCDRVQAERLAPYAFAIIETSSNRYHVFLALAKGWKWLASVRSRLLEKLHAISFQSDANPGSCSVRWPGSINFKPSRNRFLVRIVHAQPGRFTTAKELKLAGLLAYKPKPRAVAQAAGPQLSVTLPDYDRVLAGAPPAQSKKREGMPDRSIADFTWSLMARQRGAEQGEIERGLSLYSERARGRGPKYIRDTVNKAVSASA